MINMPQMVALLHSFVGCAAMLVGYARYAYDAESHEDMDGDERAETYIGIFIGSITLTGSIVACGKLQGIIRSTPLMILGNGRHIINLTIIIACVAFLIPFLYYDIETAAAFLVIMTVLALGIGWHLIMAIGGADMPVVVSMLNSYSGWATSAAGFLLNNFLLIATGALVGSSGAILSYIMCKAMNRSFFSVIAGGFG
jgi:NAD(P) transhydrogenase subunit beta